jgi:hypothetical protein
LERNKTNPPTPSSDLLLHQQDLWLTMVIQLVLAALQGRLKDLRGMWILAKIALLASTATSALTAASTAQEGNTPQLKGNVPAMSVKRVNIPTKKVVISARIA